MSTNDFYCRSKLIVCMKRKIFVHGFQGLVSSSRCHGNQFCLNDTASVSVFMIARDTQNNLVSELQSKGTEHILLRMSSVRIGRAQCMSYIRVKTNLE